jgi:two-component system, OmpR family, sensor kinase
MFRSIRWTLQLWHAVLLLVVVCIFGSVLYFGLSRARFASIDAELLGSAEVLAARIRPAPPPRGRDGEGPSTRPWGRGGFGQDPWRREGGRRGPPGEPDPSFFEEMQKKLEVPDFVQRRYEGDEATVPYFVIWGASGSVIRKSRPQMDLPSPEARAMDAPPFPPSYSQRGRFREVLVPGPFGLRVLVGRSIAREQRELRQLLWLLVATGLGVMAVGLAGGWVLSKRAVRPIRTITGTARSISACNLSQRISVSETESELGELAGVLNAMFVRLEGAFDRQVRFTADASHELRTPLSIIYSNAELALGRDRSAQEYREAIETCFRASKRMKSLVESLLTLARADAGKLEIKREQVELDQAVEDCVEMVRPLAADRKVEIKLDLQPAVCCGDAFRIAQVIMNLLTNAINYNREGGSVAVALKPDDGAAVLTVADTGVGIAEEDQKHLFERFYRVDKARSRELGGSGLGLAICRSIVEAHGGSIQFSSSLGKGTTFVVRLRTMPAGDGAKAKPVS